MPETAPQDIIVEAAHLCKHYKVGKVLIEAVKDISFTIERGAFYALVGESGCGKTTTLNMLGGLMRTTGGSIKIDREDLTRLSDRKLARFRNRHLGFVFQDFNLINVYTSYENISYPLYLAGKSRKERLGLVTAMLEKVGMEKYMNHRPTELSGGQKQRVAIARALINQPQLVLADEPTANLDSQNSDNILQLMRALNQSLGTTFIVATHSPKVMQYASHILTMKDGLLVNAA